MAKSRRLIAICALVLVALITAPPVTAQNTIHVTTTSQFGPGCTLSDAIHATNLDQPFGDCPTGSGVSTIRVPAGDYVLSAAAVDESGELTGLPYVTYPVSIVGDGPGVTIIRRDPNAPQFRLFKFQAPFTIENLTLAGGHQWHGRGGGAILAETFNWVTLPGDDSRIAANIRNVVFDGNYAASGGAVADTGFFFGPFVEFNVNDSVFTNNRSDNSGGAIYVSPGSALNLQNSRLDDNDGGQWGGGIGTATGSSVDMDIVASQFQRNQAIQGGGAIYATSPRVTGSTFVGNHARDGGGAVSSYAGRPQIIDSRFSANSARRGGAVHGLAGSLAIRGSTFDGNVATDFDGGAVDLDDRPGTSVLVNSTFSGNQAPGRGGAVYLYGGELAINNVTFAGNTAAVGPGLSLGWWGGSTVRMSNSIAAGNHVPDGPAADVHVDPNEQLISLGHNLIGSDANTRGLFTGDGDRVGTETEPLDPGLLPLADNGGPTPTHALAPSSLALDAGSPFPHGTAGSCEPADQRGKGRPGPGTPACDAGAYEHGVYFALHVSVAGNGSVTGLPGAAACIGECTAELAVGTVVTLTAEPAPGLMLLSWSGACSGDLPACTVTLTTAQSVTAAFGAPGGETITTVVSSPNPSADGEEVTITATVAPKPPALGRPTGTVQFLDSTTATMLGDIAVGPDGTATVRTSSLPAGQRTIQALYSGDSLFSPSAATLSQQVGVTVNVAPSFSMPALAPVSREDGGVQLVEHFTYALIAGPPTESAQQLVGFAITPVNTIGDVTFTSGPVLALDGTLTYQAAPNTNGLATFRVTLQDNGGTEYGGQDTSAPQDFTITIDPVNDAPSFSLAADEHASEEDAGPQAVPGFAVVESMGPTNESGQAPASYTVTPLATTGGLTFSTGPSIDAATGTLIYTTAPNANGTATFSLTLRDDGGDAAPHVNASAPLTFTISIDGVNDAPVLPDLAAQRNTDQDDVALVIAANDLEQDAITFRATGLPPGLAIDAATGRISGKAEPVTGEQQFTVTVTAADEHGRESSATFTWTITHVKPPDVSLDITEQLHLHDGVAAYGGPLPVELGVLEQLAVGDLVSAPAGPAPTSLNVTEQLAIADTVALARENTPAGTNVRVSPVGGVTLTFSGVTAPGETTAASTVVPDPPAGFEYTDPPIAFDLATSATVTGSIEVCLAHPKTVVPPRLMHFEEGRWVDRTTIHSTNTVCGDVPHLSPFAVFVPRSIPGAMHGEGAVDPQRNQRFEFQVAEREIGDERGRVVLTIKTAKHGRQKGRTDRFRSTEVHGIRFADDPRFRPGHRARPDADVVVFEGVGTWNGTSGYSFEVRAADRGEPGRGRDSFSITIRDSGGTVVAAIDGLLTEGNIQSRRLGRR